MKARRAARATVEADDMVIIKVRLPKGLVDRMDVLCKPGERAQLIRDVLADRLPPSPAIVAAERLTRAVNRLERELEKGCLDANRPIFGSQDASLSADDTSLQTTLPEVLQATRVLQGAIVDDMLAAVGRRRSRR